MEFILLVLRKFLRLQKESKFLSNITLISILGVSIGVIILEIALSVLNGFEKEIENRLVGFNLHLIIEGQEGRTLEFSDNEINRIKNLIGEEVETISPFAGQLSLLKFGRFKEGVYLKEFYLSSTKQHCDKVLLMVNTNLRIIRIYQQL